MKPSISRIAVCAALMAIAMLYGMAAQELELPPYGLAKVVLEQLGTTAAEPRAEAAWKGREPPKQYLETPGEYLATNVPELLSIGQPEDVARARKALIALLWGDPGLPAALPSAVDRDAHDARYDDIASVAEMRRLTIAMELGLESRVFHLLPKSPNGRVVLYHEGHVGEGHTSKAEIRRFVDAGFSVLVFDMPLLGANNRPTVNIPRLGVFKLESHEHLKLLSPRSGHPIKLFLEPVVVALNYLESGFDYPSVSMVGLSGGGWTTTLAAAIDPRIDRSFPVAGSYPIYLRSNSARDWGDYEQTAPEVYKTVNYLELYLLGAQGPGRKQLQVINQFDACCFAGTKWDTYKDVVSARVRELGPGEFDLFLDASHWSHDISEVAMSRILAEMNGERR